MTIPAFVFCFLLIAAPGQTSEPPPLSQEQRARLVKLKNEAEEETVRLKAQLEERQQELARAYADYDLDIKRADRLEADILELQKQMLASYRKVQVELRATVGRERFLVLKQRLDNILKSASTPPASERAAPARP